MYISLSRKGVNIDTWASISKSFGGVIHLDSDMAIVNTRNVSFRVYNSLLICSVESLCYGFNDKEKRNNKDCGIEKITFRLRRLI